MNLRSGPLNPSPLYADGKFYLLSEQGTTTVLRPSNVPTQEAEVLATNQLGDGITRASIAVAGNQLIIRTQNYLWCIGRR